MNATTLLKVIRKKCLDCSGDVRKEVQECPLKDCPLWEYRLGDPKKKKSKDEEKE